MTTIKATTLHVTLSLDVHAETVRVVSERTGISLDDVASVMLALLDMRRIEQNELRCEVDRLRKQLDEKRRQPGE